MGTNQCFYNDCALNANNSFALFQAQRLIFQMVFCLCLLIWDYKEYALHCGWSARFLVRRLICLSPEFFDWSHVKQLWNSQRGNQKWQGNWQLWQVIVEHTTLCFAVEKNDLNLMVKSKYLLAACFPLWRIIILSGKLAESRVTINTWLELFLVSTMCKEYSSEAMVVLKSISCSQLSLSCSWNV